MSRSEQKITVEQPQSQPRPGEQDSRKRLQLQELETRVAPNAIWGE